jgi:hypothetical protein
MIRADTGLEIEEVCGLVGVISQSFGCFFVTFVHFFTFFSPQKSPNFLMRWRFDEKLN